MVVRCDVVLVGCGVVGGVVKDRMEKKDEEGIEFPEYTVDPHMIKYRKGAHSFVICSRKFDEFFSYVQDMWSQTNNHPTKQGKTIDYMCCRVERRGGRRERKDGGEGKKENDKEEGNETFNNRVVISRPGKDPNLKCSGKMKIRFSFLFFLVQLFSFSILIVVF